MVAIDTPLLRVSRPVAACSRCRSAKVKCDGKLPACSACERAGKSDECSSTSDEFAKGKERNYVATLEMRIEKLEAQIKTAREEKERRKSSSVVLELDAASYSRRASENSQSVPRGGQKALRKEASNIDDLVSDFGFLSVNATARDYHGVTSSTSYTRIILAACMRKSIPAAMNKDIPYRYQAQPLIQHFLTNIFVFYPLFEETSLYSSIDAVYRASPRPVTHYDLWSVRMVLAIACASRSGVCGDADYCDAVGYVGAALQDAEIVLRPGSIAGVQAMLLLVLYSLLDPHHFDSWTIVGVASRALVDLGLHQNVPKGVAISKTKHATRKRVFWCLYSMDRLISQVQGRAFSFSDESCTVGLLKAVDAEKLVSLNMQRRHSQEQGGHAELELTPVLFMQPITPAIALVELRKIQSKIYMDVFQSGHTKWPEPTTYLHNALDATQQWWNELPTSIPGVCKDFLELEMLYIRIYLLRESPRMPSLCSLARAALFEFASSYIAKMFGRLYAARNGDSVRAAPLSFLDVEKVYTSGKQLLDVLQFDEHTIVLAGTQKGHPDSVLPQLVVPSTSLRAQESFLPGVTQTATPNAGRAIACIKMFDDVLGWLGERWSSVDKRTEFQNDAAPVIDQLNLWKNGSFKKPGSPQSESTISAPEIYTASHTNAPSRSSNQGHFQAFS
ncbi:MAG: hypothetical protein M1822_003965 [Bathelium mastoideum]|nr:MAG: hypothetical protein M1822_003965 [Bathelium mastoideum]